LLALALDATVVAVSVRVVVVAGSFIPAVTEADADEAARDRVETTD